MVAAIWQLNFWGFQISTTCVGNIILIILYAYYVLQSIFQFKIYLNIYSMKVWWTTTRENNGSDISQPEMFFYCFWSMGSADVPYSIFTNTDIYNWKDGINPFIANLGFTHAFSWIVVNKDPFLWVNIPLSLPLWIINRAALHLSSQIPIHTKVNHVYFIIPCLRPS